jgi:hypothetical protein
VAGRGEDRISGLHKGTSLTQEHRPAAYMVQVSFAICVMLHIKQVVNSAWP